MPLDRLTLILFALLLAEQLFVPGLAGSFSKIRWSRALSNLGFSLTNTLLLIPFVTAPMLIWATHLQLWHRPARMPGALAFLFDILVLDLYTYSYHVASHHLPFLWRFHAVHHLDEKMDMSTAFRSHYTEKILVQVFRCAVVIALAIPMSHIVVSHLILFWASLFNHNEALRIPRWIERYFGWLIVMPGYHATHHVPYLPYTNSNYAVAFAGWDYLFGAVTLLRPLPEMGRGLNGRSDLPFAKLLIDPLRATPPFLEPETDTRQPAYSAHRERKATMRFREGLR